MKVYQRIRLLVKTTENGDRGCSLLYLFIFSVLAFITIYVLYPILDYFQSEIIFIDSLSPHVMIVHAMVNGNNIQAVMVMDGYS
jgi:hypothetical protein